MSLSGVITPGKMCIGLGRYQATSVPVADPGNVPGDWYFQIKTQNQ